MNTSSHGWRKLYAVEGTTNRFNDEGIASTVNGTATIMMDPIYLETVNTSAPYLVHVTAYGDASLYVESRQADRFAVRSKGGDVSFGWEVSALRRWYEQYRLEEWENG